MANGGKERATAVPNQDGKEKRRWMVAMVQEEASGERTVAKVDKEPPRPT
jgi:hypothetical protein